MTTKTKIKIAAAVVLALALAGGWLYVKALKADNRRLTLTAETAWAENDQLRRDSAGLRLALAENFKALEEREKRLVELTGQAENLRKELEGLYATNEPCGLWADSPVPGPVLDRVRR